MNFCLHESAHSVARQLIIGDLGQVGLKKKYAYSYPVERRPFGELSKEELTKIAVVVAAGIAAEYGLCSSGLGTSKELAIADDLRQFKAIQRICAFSNEEMQAFVEEACNIIESYETVIRKVATELRAHFKTATPGACADRNTPKIGEYLLRSARPCSRPSCLQQGFEMHS